MKFKNPQNDYVEESWCPWLYALCFGPLYFLSKGIYRHFLVYVLAMIITSFTVIVPVLAWLYYAFFASEILREHYLSKGWSEITPALSKNAPTGVFFNMNSETVFFIAAGALAVWIFATVFGK